MMIDTIDLKYYIDCTEYPTVVRGANRFIRKRNIPGHKKMLHPSERKDGRKIVTASFGDMGIQEFAVCCDQYLMNDGSDILASDYYVRITARPAVVLYPEDPCALCGEDDLDRAEQEINRFIGELNQHIGYRLLPPAGEWRVTRIDYARQFRSPDYLAYLLLLKKECPVKKSRVYSALCTEKIPAEIRYWNGSITFHVYDKTVQLWEKFGYCCDGPPGSGHLLRFEDQCRGRCISGIIYKLGMDRATIRTLWDSDIADMKIRNAIRKVIGIEDFYSLSNACRVLSEQFSERKVRDMAEFMRPGAYPKTKGNKLVSLYAERSGLSENQVKRNFIPYFHKAGVNIRILPDKWGMDYLANPLKLLGLDRK